MGYTIIVEERAQADIREAARWEDEIVRILHVRHSAQDDWRQDAE